VNPGVVSIYYVSHDIAGTRMVMDLLQTGIDRSVIALWVGHESVETTHFYLEATLAMKEQTLAKTTPPNGQSGSLSTWSGQRIWLIRLARGQLIGS